MARPGYKGITLKESTVHTLSEITKKLADTHATLSNGDPVESIPDTILYLCEQFTKYEGLNQGIHKLENHAEIEKKIAETQSSAQRGDPA